MYSSTVQLQQPDLKGVFSSCGNFTATEFSNCFTVTGFEKIYPSTLTIVVAKNYPASNFSASLVTNLSELFKPVKEIVSQISRNLEIPLTGRYDKYDVRCLVGYFAHTEDFDVGTRDSVFTFDIANSHLNNSALLCRRIIPKTECESWLRYLRATENPKFMGYAQAVLDDEVAFYWSSTYSRIFDDPEILLAGLVADSLENNVYEKLQFRNHKP